MSHLLVLRQDAKEAAVGAGILYSLQKSGTLWDMCHPLAN